MNLSWELENNKQTMYFVFIIKIGHKSVSTYNGKITGKEIKKLFSCDYITSRQNVEKRLIDNEPIQERIMDFDYYEGYLTSISNKIFLWQC